MRLVSSITIEAVREPGLTEGSEVTAVIGNHYVVAVPGPFSVSP